MQIVRALAMVVVLIVVGSGAAPSQAQTNKPSLDATGQLIVDTIKNMCRQSHPDGEQEFRECSVKRYNAMKGFFTKLFHYRDTKGIRSDEFKKGLACVESASPVVREQDRKVAVERADWIRANDCYKSALR